MLSDVAKLETDMAQGSELTGCQGMVSSLANDAVGFSKDDADDM